MSKKNKDKLDEIEKLRESVIDKISLDDYPKEAMALGTYVSLNGNKGLGLIADSFYGDVDTTGKKIIVYTILWLPKKNNYAVYAEKSSTSDGKYYISNEYEYDIIGYLMINPVDMSKIALQTGGYTL
jgi:hypothetical protein